jgi:hypothetical protein
VKYATQAAKPLGMATLAAERWVVS